MKVYTNQSFVLSHAGLLVDFRDPFVEVGESTGNVTLCVYICDGGLKRNASITFATEATCE